MTQIKLKRVYDDWDKSDGFRVLVDKLWPRGIKKEELHFDLWAKEITPTPDLRNWFHEDIPNRWDAFISSYKKELGESSSMKTFIETIKQHPVVTLLYASKDKEHSHVLILKAFLDKELGNK